ncbi:MAG: hypothetical protein CVU69_02865 [Deltaproteobacteria bacterium HGW-Deltaproteobacteria-4]|nr:MAG: hypothetical protein CVU69_02865 [Deltaproteobacteria bacterium HGW-Deltaproteobacteria-4]
MVRLLKSTGYVVLALLAVSLMACGGGGGGGGSAPTLKLTGTVSDSTQAPVDGATVFAYSDTNSIIAQATTNAVGRYSFTTLPVNAPLTLKVSGPAGTFPAQAEKITLSSSAPTVLDFYLPSTAPASETTAGSGIWQSPAQIHGPRRAVVASLSPAQTAVNVAPFDVSLIGDGYPVYSVSPLAVGVDEIIELYAAAAFSVSGATITSADLYLPVPLVLDVAAAAAAAPVLYRFDETINAWVDTTITPVLTVDPVSSAPAFRATVTQAGLYRVGKVVPATPVTGTLTYSDGTTPAAGVTVHVTGSATGNAYGYQQEVVTDSLGQYTALVKTGGTTSYTFTAWGFGVELSQSSATPTATLAFAKPTYGVPATATLTLDDPAVLPNTSADSIGLIVASGRLSNDPVVIDGTTLTDGRADVSFNVNSFDGSLTLNATTKGSGIQQAAVGKTFANLTVAPTTGYADATTFATIPVPTTIPTGGLLVVVKTSDGYAKISIDSVTETPANSGNWVITFRSAFSLSGNF